MSDDVFDFGPAEFRKSGNGNDGKRYGFVIDSERANRFGFWSGADDYCNAPQGVAEQMSKSYGEQVLQQNCAFTVVDNDVVTSGYDAKGPNGGRWINARTLTPINGKAARELSEKYKSVIDLLATPVQSPVQV
jgi:hypothetical protein